ncbi:Serpin E3 [Platysternon megacephalum]|uniref:Serpin E3 n=1 Tax=Platysternon megacephalum TaxID=55544 RepID=A0A4D9EI49_9SAUR|nr:Serpin E3 [Platysternon megacephalum]
MLPLDFTVLVLYSCFLTSGSCDELKELKTEFDINLYQRLAEPENGTNLIVAPASVSISLGLLQFGAQGNTFMQLENALGYNIHDPKVQDFLHTGYEEVTNSSQGPVVQLACALFVQAGVHLSPDFIEHSALWANSSLQKINFSEPNSTAAQINEWVTGNIEGGEADCIHLDTVGSPLTQMAVVSTMYFKSMWQKKFSFTDTQSLPFTTAEGVTLKVPTMYHTAEVNYGQFHTASLERFSVAELPYLGETVSMFVVLPSDRTSLSQIESHLSAKIITVWANSLKRMKMDIFLPRFRIQSHFDLKMVLPALGITDMFDPTEADFKGISEQGGLYISEAIHKAKIEVTEEGTKASGATDGYEQGKWCLDQALVLSMKKIPVFNLNRDDSFEGWVKKIEPEGK